jgi:allantoicase
MAYFEKFPLENIKTVFEAQIGAHLTNHRSHFRTVADHRTDSLTDSLITECTELSSVALGGEVTSVSDEFFSAAHHLFLVEVVPPRLCLTPVRSSHSNYLLYFVWSSRHKVWKVSTGRTVRSSVACRCITKLGASGSITGFDVDTSHFNGAPLNRRTSAERNIGNEAPEVSVDALLAADGEIDPLPDDERVWILTLEHVRSS